VSKRPDAFSRNTIKAGHAQKGLVPKFSVKKPVRNLGFTKKLGTLTATPRSFVTRTCKKTAVLPQLRLSAGICGKKS
jgi:hypothetical protein